MIQGRNEAGGAMYKRAVSALALSDKNLTCNELNGSCCRGNKPANNTNMEKKVKLPRPANKTS